MSAEMTGGSAAFHRAWLESYEARMAEVAKRYAFFPGEGARVRGEMSPFHVFGHSLKVERPCKWDGHEEIHSVRVGLVHFEVGGHYGSITYRITLRDNGGSDRDIVSKTWYRNSHAPSAVEVSQSMEDAWNSYAVRVSDALLEKQP